MLADIAEQRNALAALCRRYGWLGWRFSARPPATQILAQAAAMLIFSSPFSLLPAMILRALQI
jgi:hypothetical protein